ncbi:MAG: bi-domain-containing oxidoreductase [Ignavibacteriae bacterium]|nr:bi-domain-containing oxidoreductase [Ignavibacteriota bacterium]
MKQIIQYQKTGEITIEDLPVPVLKKGYVLVKNAFSLISSGTERTSVETAQASMIGKAKSRPDLVKQVLDNVKKEGLKATYNKVQNRLDNYKELGYSTAGVIIESSVDNLKPGDRVACAGLTANHSEVISVPKNLVVKIPENVSYEEASFTTLGSIALQGVRQADVKIGEAVAVVGLGLIGLITMQLLKANGCRVIGIDINESNFEIAKKLGCDICCLSGGDSVKIVESFTRGFGTDSVIITAGAKSNEPVELAIEYARKKSNIVIVGAVNMNIPRSQFYEKELDFRISCSYGPGRYDKLYEETGIDYPVGYVRWTENRNMSAVLDLLSAGKLDVKSLITQVFKIENALDAYKIITGEKKEKYIAVLISYPENLITERKIYNKKTGAVSETGIYAGFIGAGNFAQSNLLPHLSSQKIALEGVCTSTPVNSKSAAEKFGFDFFTTDYNEILQNDKINTVFIASRHDSHGKYVLESIKAGKHVFAEKPLVINSEELENIRDSYNPQKHLLVGFNRRFSAPFRDIKKFFGNNLEPYVITFRVNAGLIPKNHWVQAPEQGGRIIGEVCHFIDTVSFLTDSKPVKVFAESIYTDNSNMINHDNVNIVIKYENGSVGNILYLANGNSSQPKEYCEVFAGGKTAEMDNYKEVTFYSGGKKNSKSYNGTKGHREEIFHFINLLNGKEEVTLSPDSIFKTTLLTFKILDSLKSGVPETI